MERAQRGVLLLQDADLDGGLQRHTRLLHIYKTLRLNTVRAQCYKCIRPARASVIVVFFMVCGSINGFQCKILSCILRGYCAVY